ncbi:DUF11 domain-containing protein, partial [Methanobrevibacter curvatus]|uniref:DUF11 domain-containing protein n=1 Tax=Methanobrevibacter curvatus TaxID=49547 RepID=UPI000A75ED52
NGTGNIVNIANVTSLNENNTGDWYAITPEVGQNTTILPAVNLSITKSANVSGANNGEYVLYIVSVTNFGPDATTGLFIRDVLDSKLIFIGSSASLGSYNSTSSLWNIGSLANGNTVSLNITVRLNGIGNITNVVNVSSLNENNTGDNQSNTVLVVVGSTVNLSITKRSNVSGNVLNGAFVSYVISVTNYGPNTATNLELVDVLNSSLIYINSSTTNSESNYNSPSGLWRIGSLASGVSATLTIVVRLNGTGTIFNEINVTSLNESNVGDTSANTSTSGNIVVVPTVNLSISKRSNITGSTILNGAFVSYIINVTNFGPDAATGLVITDLIDSRLIYNHSSASGSADQYNPITQVWNIGSLANGASANLNITVRLNGTGNILNVANVTSLNENNTGDWYAMSPEIGQNVTVLPTVNLSITKRSNVSGTVLNGIFVKYTVNVTNFGPDAATGFGMEDVLDYRLVYNSSNSSRSGADYDPNTNIWNIGTLANGETITLDIIVILNGTGDIYNEADVFSLNENNTGDWFGSTSSEYLTVTPTVNLSITKSSNVSGSVLNGILVLYSINVTNFGPDNATGLVITDRLDSRLIYINSTTPRGTSYVASTGVWNINTLANGESIVLDIVVKLNGTGNIVNVANVTNVNENNTGNNSSTPDNTTNITVVPTVNISVVKSSNVSGNVLNGIFVLYSINVTNFGPDNATGLVITDVLDSRLIYINSTAPRGTSYVVSTGVWDINTLANGESIVLDILVRLNGTGSIVNVANVTNVNENNTGNNSSTPDNTTNFTVVPTVNLSVVKTSNVSGSVLNGAFVLYTINVTNFGPDNATGLVITDRLDSRLIYINSTTPRFTYYVPGTGVWSIGALANGESIVLDILVRLNGTGSIVNVANVTNVNENNTGNNSSTP